MKNYFQILFFKFDDKINSSHKKKFNKVSAKEALLGCSNQLNELKLKHCKKDYGKNPEYLINFIFKPVWEINNDIEANAYCRANLYVAVDEFKNLIKQIKETAGRLNYYTIKKYNEQIREFISDLRPIIIILEKNNDLFKFILLKVNHHFSYEIFHVSHALFWYPNFKGNLLYKKATLNLTVFTIRQCLEIRFRQISGVYRMYNKKGQDIKLRHDFYVEFYKKNKDLIKFESLSISLSGLFKIYKWSNTTIHNGLIPRIWQISYALSSINNFFLPKKYSTTTKKGTSIYGSVKILDYQELLELLTDEVYNKTNEIFCLDLDRPESIVEQ